MKKENEIDIIALVKKIFAKPKVLAIYVSVSVAIGVVVALSTPKEYTASVVLAPEMSGGGLGLSGGLADMASNLGIDLSSGAKGLDAIYPEIYPEIFTSTDFVRGLFSVKVRTAKTNEEKTYYTHLMKDTKIPFWQYPKMWLAKKMKKKDPSEPQKGGKPDPMKMSREDSELCEGIAKSISCQVDKKTSVITIVVGDQDPLVAAIMADTLQRRLQAYITEYRTKKAKTDYAYYKKLYAEAKTKYQKAQAVYASYCDANQDVVLESFQAKRDELENNMQTAFNNMSQLNTQMQAADAKIQERTPAFTILSQAKMPYKSTSTPRAVVVIMFAFLGLVVRSLVVALRMSKSKAGQVGETEETAELPAAESGEAQLESTTDTEEQ